MVGEVGIMTHKCRTKSQRKKEDPWFVDKEIRNRVMNLCKDYRIYEIKAQKMDPNIDIEDYISQNSPANMSSCGGQSNLISRPIENVVIKYNTDKESLTREIEEAGYIVKAIDNGIEEAARYMRQLKKRKLLVISLKRVLIDGKTYLSAKTLATANALASEPPDKLDNTMILSDSTIRSYKEKAIFFIAYFLGYISEKELKERNLPKRDCELPQTDGIYDESEEKVWEEESVTSEIKEQWRKKKALKQRSKKKGE